MAQAKLNLSWRVAKHAIERRASKQTPRLLRNKASESREEGKKAYKPMLPQKPNIRILLAFITRQRP